MLSLPLIMSLVCNMLTDLMSSRSVDGAYTCTVHKGRSRRVNMYMLNFVQRRKKEADYAMKGSKGEGCCK